MLAVTNCDKKKGKYAMNKLEELEKKYKELGEEIERLKCKSAERWRADYGCEYFYIDDDGDIQSEQDNDWGCDEYRFNIGNYFKTEEEACKVLDKILIYNKLKDLALKLNEGKTIDWKDDTQEKFCIYFSNVANRLTCDFCSIYQDFGTIYCLNSNFLDKALDEIGEEDLMRLFKE